MKKSYLLIGLVAVAALVIALIFLVGGKGGRSGEAGDEPSADEPETEVSSRARVPTLKSGQVPKNPWEADEEEGSGAPVVGRRQTSGVPLSKDDHHAMLDPIGGEQTTGTMSARATEDKLRYVFKASRSAVVGDDTLEATLAVYRGETTETVPVQVLSASLRTVETDKLTETELTELAFNDGGRDGDAQASDRVLTARVEPSTLKLAPGYYRVYVRFQADDRASVASRVVFLYTPEEQVPARFTGRVEDKIDDGSLVVDIEIEVEQAGQYWVGANVYDLDGEPIARGYVRRPVEKGTAKIDIRIGGAVIRGTGRPGPYLVRHVHGYRTTGNAYPDHRQAMAGAGGEHRTASYALDDF